MAYRNLYANSDRRGESSAVSSVLYTAHGQSSLPETRGGSYIYDGNPSHFHEWCFRSLLKAYKGRDVDRYAESMSRIMDGLRGIAFVVAQEIGLADLMHPGDEVPEPEVRDLDAPPPERLGPELARRPAGIDVLITAMKAAVFPLTTHEAKELFRQYCKSNGSLARQTSESMHQYVNRRKRCWKLLKELDGEIQLSEGHRADMLLDLAGIDRGEKIMIQASIGNVRDFERIADALILQHPRIHMREKTARPSFPKGGGKRKGKFVKGKGKR